MSFSIPSPQLPAVPQAPGAPPMFGTPQAGPGQKPQPMSSQPTYIGSQLTPQAGQATGKTLLGQ